MDNPELGEEIVFANPCFNLPAGRVPHDGKGDGGWRLAILEDNDDEPDYSGPVTDAENHQDEVQCAQHYF